MSQLSQCHVKRLTVPRTSVVLSPSWSPRVEGVEGLALDVDAPLNGNDRAVVEATLRPKSLPAPHWCGTVTLTVSRSRA